MKKSIAFGPIPVIYNDSLFWELQKRPIQGKEKRIYHFLHLYKNEIEIYYHAQNTGIALVIPRLCNKEQAKKNKLIALIFIVSDYQVYRKFKAKEPNPSLRLKV